MPLNIESFEDSQRGGFIDLKNYKDHHLFLTYKAYNAEFETKKYGKKPSVNVDVVALEDDGSFTEYANQWLLGGALNAFFIGSKSGKIKPKDIGWQGVVKLVRLPPTPDNDKGSWAFASPSRNE